MAKDTHKFIEFVDSLFCILIFFYFFYPFIISAATVVVENEGVTVSATVLRTGGGRPIISNTSVLFSGEAYPEAIVTILKNGSIVATVKANANGLFDATLEEKYDKNILYTLFARDSSGNKSLLINYPLVVSTGYLTHLAGIRFPPTIVPDKLAVRQNDSVSVRGYALPEKELQIIIEANNKEYQKFTLFSERDGKYNLALPFSDIPKGKYNLYIKYPDTNRKSVLINLIVGDKNVKNTDNLNNIPGYCNDDNLINLVDFSILAFWYKKKEPPMCIDINKDKIIDLTDFSILAYYWTN